MRTSKQIQEKRDLLKALIMAQNLLDKCEDELGGFTSPVRGQRRTIDEQIRKHTQLINRVPAR